MEKKKRNYFKIILYSIIALYLLVYVLGVSSYSEVEVAKNVTLTNEAINQFEEDIINGEVIDITSYMEVEKNDYSNKFTDLGENFSTAVINFVGSAVPKITNIFTYLLT